VLQVGQGRYRRWRVILGPKTQRQTKFVDSLATADWLRQKGVEPLTSGAVAKALAENQQSRLVNPSESLNKNVAKGHCEKTAGGFFVTPDGLVELGYK
jgi:hypothetical protein